MSPLTIGILGAGSWGLTLAWLLSMPVGTGSRQPNLWLWDRNPEKLAALAANRHVQFPLTLTLPDSVELVENLADNLANTDVLILAVTAKGTRPVCNRLFEAGLPAKTIVVNASKGLDGESLKRLSQVIGDTLPHNANAVLSGPTLAREILNGLPTAASIACADLDITEYLQGCLSRSQCFRLYANPDVIGVELGGALKNIFAIASGYIAEKKLGDNAKAALLTRGLHEMTHVATRLGAQDMTLYGLSGLGDLLATSNSPLSRNYQLGQRLAKGQLLEDILDDMKVVVEGVQTTHTVCQLGEKLDLDLPITHEIQKALTGKASETDIIQSLMTRRLRSEITSLP
ncbi:MAG: NAD(P)-dependent glycerol-3-phosphate dehydrogenase [Cyanobacteria bacterium HKST-UBA04]|nr:NAD(P)-dependent glycerol-3-phosphate dehydrogenase [Cyanobacteria bacterium HKST-UBA04]MCA9842607.1 NAD(P)-dependent glycerol-3-phosphate dehydrogenase [Cyanobacteria bacterium HKST-UBA03]